jgi:glycosyltransferase involved in cell wall biosynthesis
MNICMVLADVDFPPDIRVEKEARSLLSAGHRVILLCHGSKGRPAASVWKGVEIIRIAPLPLLLRKLNAVFFVLFLRDLQWKKAVQRTVKAHAIDAIHVHDLPMVGTALSAARRRRLPVVADLHEHYPVMVRMAFSTRRVRLAERFMWPSRWERVEKRWAMRCARVLAVVEEMKERLVRKGIRPEAITLVENTVDVDHFLSLGIREELVRRYQGEFVICYVGNFSWYRGLDAAITAMPRILQDIPNARLLLVGDGPAMGQLKRLAASVGLDDKVTFTGRVSFDLVPTYIALSEVCILPLESTPQTEASSPHKLFQYMLMGKPVVVSSCRSLRRVVEGSGAGLVFEAGNTDSYAQAIIRLADPVVRRKLAEAGRKAALEKYNWRTASNSLLATYQRLAQAPNRRTPLRSLDLGRSVCKDGGRLPR